MQSKITQSFTRQPSLQSLSWSAAILKFVDARPSPLLYNGHASVHFYSPSGLRVTFRRASGTDHSASLVTGTGCLSVSALRIVG